jgi:antitoxin component of MazEF toxin-antitoxin module
METKIRKIGNSSGIILPKALIDKYDLAEVIIEDHGDGIMIRPAVKSLFQVKMEEAKKNKKAIYSEMADVKVCLAKVLELI